MSYTKIYIHAVWATKDIYPYLTSEIKPQVIRHIIENARIKKICIDEIEGYFDHLHCLISLSSDQNIATLMNLIKGESSFWINRQKLTKKKFGWHDEYFAVSVGQSQVDTIKRYIGKQEIVHKTKTFRQEYDEFLSHYQFEEEKG